MIQEIFDYLLIRSTLVNSTSQEIIENANDKEIFSYFVHTISSLMQQEDFILMDKSLQEKVSDFIQFYRFDYNTNKDLNQEMNYIIGRLCDYKNMSINNRKILMNNWLKQETVYRGLPWYFSTKENIFHLISLDIFYLNGMFLMNGKFEIDNVIEYLSLINIILNKFPEYFNQDIRFLEMTRENCDFISSIKQMPRFILKMNKKILENLNKNYKINSEMNEKITEKVTYEVVKRKRR